MRRYKKKLIAFVMIALILSLGMMIRSIIIEQQKMPVLLGREQGVLAITYFRPNDVGDWKQDFREAEVDGHRMVFEVFIMPEWLFNEMGVGDSQEEYDLFTLLKSPAENHATITHYFNGVKEKDYQVGLEDQWYLDMLACVDESIADASNPWRHALERRRRRSFTRPRSSSNPTNPPRISQEEAELKRANEYARLVICAYVYDEGQWKTCVFAYGFDSVGEDMKIQLPSRGLWAELTDYKENFLALFSQACPELFAPDQTP